MWALPIVTRLVRLALGRDFCFPLYIPTVLGRAITIGTALSALRIPGLGELLRLLLRVSARAVCRSAWSRTACTARTTDVHAWAKLSRFTSRFTAPFFPCPRRCSTATLASGTARCRCRTTAR